MVLAAVLLVPRSALANGSDLPPEIILQGYIKPEGGRLRQLVRIPLVFLQPFALPKRGPGYLDLAKMDEVLLVAAAAAARQIELREDGVLLVPTARQARVSLLSDRSFQSYDAALAHLRGPRLPAETNLFWNQGFFDAELEYAIRSADGPFSIRTNVMPGLGLRVKLELELVAEGRSARHYVLSGGSGWVALDPRWYDAAWFFLRHGFIDAVSLERFVFLLCLLAPFTQWRSLLALVLALSVLQALTLTATALGAMASTRWLGEIADVGAAAATLLLAIANLGAPSAHRRWLLAGVVGSLSGFALGISFAELRQFAGSHALVAVLSFNLAVVLAQVAAAALAWAAMRLVARVLGARLGMVVMSAILGHQAWHWMLDRGHQFGHELEHAGHAGLRSAVFLSALWLIPALIVGAAAWLAKEKPARDG
ncbi:MAG TPA: HupE/UreJ family protein [Burkholderiales bacterium]|nr:HupE/UreJ family protein [Burkholderiales bacterium]